MTLVQGQIRTLWTSQVIGKMQALAKDQPSLKSREAYKLLIEDNTLYWKPELGIFRVYCSRHGIQFGRNYEYSPKHLRLVPEHVRDRLREAASKRNIHWYLLVSNLLNVICDDNLIDGILDDLQ